VVVGVVEEDQFEFLVGVVGLAVLEFELVSAGDALGVHVGPRASFKAVGVRLQCQLVLLALLQDEIPEVVLVVHNLVDLPVFGEDEVGSVVGRNVLGNLGPALLAIGEETGIGGNLSSVFGFGVYHDTSSTHSFDHLPLTPIAMHIFISKWRE
jgi:hypothetical protein